MKIGFNQATSMHCSTLEQDVVLCEENGFDYIEFRLDKLREYLQLHTVNDLQALLASKKIKPHALNALYTYDDLFVSESEKDRVLTDEFIWGCQIAKQINAEYFIVVPPLQRDPLGGPYVGTVENTHQNCVRILKRLSQIARDYNIKLCFELVGFERSSVRTIRQASDIINDVNEDNVGFVFDAYNIHLYNGVNDFSELKQVNPDKIFCAHINNGDPSDIKTATQADRTFCDTGNVNLANFLKALKDTGYNDIVSIETFRPEYWQQTPEWVISRAYQTTRKIMADCNVL